MAAVALALMAAVVVGLVPLRPRIRRDDKQPDVLVHISDVIMEFMGDQLEVGQRVTFELGRDPKSGKTKAVNVRIS